MNRDEGTSGVTRPGDAPVALAEVRVRLHRTAAGVILYDMARDRLYDGNHAAGAILGLLDGRKTCRQLACHLARRFRTSPAHTGRDLAAFLRRLQRLGLLEVRR